MADVEHGFGVRKVEQRDPKLVETLNHHTFEPNQPGVRGDQPGDVGPAWRPFGVLVKKRNCLGSWRVSSPRSVSR
jgi:hypothetical protein